MFIGLFLLWIIFNGNITWEIVLIGLAVTIPLELLTCRLMGCKPGREFARAYDFLHLVPYFLTLIAEIVQCGSRVIWFIMHPSEEIEPQIICFRTKIKSKGLRVLMANSITLTPGTITVNVEGDRYRVHGLDKSFLEGIATSDFELMLEDAEKKGAGKNG